VWVKVWLRLSGCSVLSVSPCDPIFSATANDAKGGHVLRRLCVSAYLLRRFVRIRSVARGAGAARAHEEFAAVVQRHVAAIGAAHRRAQMILALVAAHDDPVAGLERI